MIRDHNNKKWYKPREIAQRRLITSPAAGSSVDGNYMFILNQIKAGRLEATNYSTSKKVKYYLVSEDAIRKFYKGLTVSRSYSKDQSLKNY
jgi:hypothetical protein